MIMRSAVRELSATRRTIFISALMILTAAASGTLRPVAPAPPPAPDLERLLPDSFANWTRIPIGAAVLPEEAEKGPGEATAYRAYRDDAGRIVTLVVAYGPPLGDSVRLHRPESCYVAQGFAVVSQENAQLSLAGVDARIVRLATKGPSRNEAVTYWLRDGAIFTTHDSAGQIAAFRRAGARFDGVLVRASSTGAGPAQFEAQTEFLKEFAGALAPEARAVLLGPDGAV